MGTLDESDAAAVDSYRQGTKKPLLGVKWFTDPKELHLSVNDEYRLNSDLASVTAALSGLVEEKTAAACWRREAPPWRRIAETERLETLCIFTQQDEFKWIWREGKRKSKREKGFGFMGTNEANTTEGDWEGFSRVQLRVWEGSGAWRWRIVPN